MEQTFLMIKPDGVRRRLMGDIICRLERKGFRMVAAKWMQLSEELATEHYSHHKEKPFFSALVSFITSGPVLAMVWEGDNIITLSRKLIGSTQIEAAEPGTIRGDYATHTRYNLIHGSDSKEAANEEINRFFSKGDFFVRYE